MKASQKTIKTSQKKRRPKPDTDHAVNICDDWNGSQGDKVTWTNTTQGNCIISQDGSNTWPFREGPPIPASGSIAPGGEASAHLKNKNELPDGSYTYGVDCCANATPKTVTVP
jgi:hypothetical protein